MGQRVSTVPPQEGVCRGQMPSCACAWRATLREKLHTEVVPSTPTGCDVPADRDMATGHGASTLRCAGLGSSAQGSSRVLTC